MTIAAIIAEYNPFHNGHEYMIKKIKEDTGADYIIAVMSGAFTQRGIPGIADKFTRAKMAVACGIDAVFELPVRFATSNAEVFAMGAVSFFHALSCVDYLAFGSECGSLSDFMEASEFLLQEPEEFQTAIKQYLKQGLSYPKAFSLAAGQSGSSNAPSTSREQTKTSAPFSSGLLAHPNNVLGLEYVKALKKLSSTIRPHTISRTGTGYHDDHASYSKEADTLIASASAIRTALGSRTGNIAMAQPLLPPEAYRVFAENYGTMGPASLDDFSLLLSVRLAGETRESLSSYLDVPAELADRILSFRETYMTFSELISAIKHKQYTYARINRALLHILLNLKDTGEKLSATPSKPLVPYGRLLAMKKNSSSVIKEIKAHSQIPVITKPAEAKKVLSGEALALFQEDVSAADLYFRMLSFKYGTKFLHDVQRTIELI